MSHSIFFICVLLLSALSWTAVNPDTISDNGWAMLIRSGDGPRYGADVHWAVDTAGYAYMFGGCTYENGAGGSHNNDVYRFNLLTGYVDRLSNCGNNVLDYKGGCQAPHCYDSKRNCVWTSSAFSPTCASGRSGLLKFQCPDGPLTQVNGTGGGHYFAYDPVNDLIYRPNGGSGGVSIYDPNTNTWSSVAYPGNSHGIESFAVPCCVDTRRGLFIMAMWCNYGETDFQNDVWILDGATRQWQVRTPAAHPDFYAGNINLDLAYDPLNDKCIYFGMWNRGCASEVWAYDYTSNAWTQMPADGRAYNDADKAASTWPPAMNCNTWAYCEKYNVFAAWGGGTWMNDKSCADYGEWDQPVWLYRYSASGTNAAAPVIRLLPKNGLRVWPNPAHSSISVRLEGLGAGASSVIRLFNLRGQQVGRLSQDGAVEAWDLSALPSGIYQLRAEMNGRVHGRTIILEK